MRGSNAARCNERDDIVRKSTRQSAKRESCIAAFVRERKRETIHLQRTSCDRRKAARDDHRGVAAIVVYRVKLPRRNKQREGNRGRRCEISRPPPPLPRTYLPVPRRVLTRDTPVFNDNFTWRVTATTYMTQFHKVSLKKRYEGASTYLKPWDRWRRPDTFEMVSLCARSLRCAHI